MFHVKHRGKMLKSNWHTHTYRCGHAIGTEEEYVLAAIKAGVKRLGFSDHCPFPGIYQDRARMDYEEFEDVLRRALGATMILNVNNLKTEKEVLQWYVDMNAGGTPHTTEEINRVKKMIGELG